jgi:hypothetical protein
MRFLKQIALLFFFGLFSLQVQAQWGDEEMAEKPSFKDRIFTGGGVGLSFGSNYDFISLSPIIGYRLSQRLAAGTSIIFRYTNYKYVTPDVSTTDYGISPFLRFQFYGPLFLHAEYEYLNTQYIDAYTGQTVRKDFSSFMAGGGFFQPIGRHTAFFVTALYNFSYRNPSNPYDYYPYSSPLVLRAGITAGF